MPDLDVEDTGRRLALLASVVGNTNTRFGIFDGRELVRSSRVPNVSEANIVDQLAHADAEMPGGEVSAVVIPSDNDPLTDRLLETLAPRLSHSL